MIAVIGGAGFIGSHIAKQLRQQRLDHFIVDNLSTGHRAAAQSSRLFEADILDTPALERIFAEFSPSAVIHLAGSIDVAESVQNPEKYRRNNLLGTKSLLLAMRSCKVRRLIFSSTAGVYGNINQPMLSESSPVEPVSPYAQTKLEAERAIQSCAAGDGLRSVIFRYFNAAGCDPEGELGEDHRPETHLIPRAIDFALGRASRFTVFGTDYPTHDGTCIRDYVHVADIATAHLLALAVLETSHESFVMNLGTQSGASVYEVLKEVERQTGETLDVEKGDRRLGDPPRLVADPSLAREILGWIPERSNLPEMVAHALAWRKQHPQGYGP